MNTNWRIKKGIFSGGVIGWLPHRYASSSPEPEPEPEPVTTNRRNLFENRRGGFRFHGVRGGGHFNRWK